MSIQIKRLMSLLLAVLMVIPIPISAFATSAQEDGTATGPGTTEPLSPEHQLISDALPEVDCGGASDFSYPYGLPVDSFYPAEAQLRAMARADMEAIPDEMYDNAILRALEYAGFDVQWLKDNGYLYVRNYISSNLKTNAPHVLSNIGYAERRYLNGDETVPDPSTISGLAPDIALFEEYGLVCASFVSYFINSYLPNVEGVNTSHIHEAIKATTMNNGNYSTASVWSWNTGLNNLAKQAGSGVTKYTDATTAYANLVPGDIIIFSDSSGGLTHVAIYAGEYYLYTKSGTNGGLAHFIIHVGNSRGPEISTVEFMGNAGAKSSTPSAWFHLDVNDAVENRGWIEVDKRDTDGNALPGAYFTAVNDTTNDTFVIGPTDANGYAKSGEMPMGVYTVTETVFPDGYESSETSTWTATLTKDTPNLTFTIHAVNQKIMGGLMIQKVTNTGENLAGWSFGVYTDEACTRSISETPFKTGADGSVAIPSLVPGTYYVKELNGNDEFWDADNVVKTVQVEGGKTITVTVLNTHYGYAEIVKATNTGKDLGGWKFNIYMDEACINSIDGSPFITAEDGTVRVKLLPGTYFIREVDESDQHPEWIYDTEVRTVTVIAGQTKPVTFTNCIQFGEIVVQKVNERGEPLSGARFYLEWSTDGTVWNAVTYADPQNVTEGTCTSQGLDGGFLVTDDGGLATFTGLHPALLYRLTEAKAPDGYQLLTRPAYEGGLSMESDLVVTVKVVNFPSFELPKTGSHSLMLMSLIGCLLVSCAGVLLLSASRKKKDV